jgi:hypothetical protein
LLLLLLLLVVDVDGEEEEELIQLSQFISVLWECVKPMARSAAMVALRGGRSGKEGQRREGREEEWCR